MKVKEDKVVMIFENAAGEEIEVAVTRKEAELLQGARIEWCGNDIGYEQFSVENVPDIKTIEFSRGVTPDEYELYTALLEKMRSVYKVKEHQKLLELVVNEHMYGYFCQGWAEEEEDECKATRKLLENMSIEELNEQIKKEREVNLNMVRNSLKTGDDFENFDTLMKLYPASTKKYLQILIGDNEAA